MGDRFAVREVQRQIEKKKKQDKKNKELGIGGKDVENTNRKYKSGKFFADFSKITTQDKQRKDLKRTVGQSGKAEKTVHANVSAKKFRT